MAESRIIPMKGDTVGLIVRGKLAADHDPDVLQQHADCILPDGSPLGYFGEGNEAKLNSVGLDMQGAVYDHAAMRIHRPFYVNVDAAVAYRVVSTVLLVTVSKREALRFKTYWEELKRAPGTFHLLGANCSSHASEAFIAAGIVKKGIPGLDTPNNLYKQIAKQRKDAVSMTGYVGFNQRSGGFDLVVRAFKLSRGVAAPRQTRSERLSSMGV